MVAIVSDIQYISFRGEEGILADLFQPFNMRDFLRSRKKENKCSVGPETSTPEIEKFKAKLPFLREDFSFPRLDGCQTERSEV